MNLLKQTSPTGGVQGGPPSSLFGTNASGARLTPSPHYKSSDPGSPLTSPPHGHPLLQMGGENSAFKALVPGARVLPGYDSESDDEEINVNDDDSDMDDRGRHRMSGTSSPLDVVVDSPNGQQPLQLTMHDRE